MVPTPRFIRRNSSSPPTGIFVVVASLVSSHVPNLAQVLRGYLGLDNDVGHGAYNGALDTGGGGMHSFAKREKHDAQFTAFAILIPVLVLLSGLFAGLTLGYMSLDETQLNVLSISGTPEQKKYASKIKPLRENGHLLLVTLLLANMIVNETLPVISDQVLGGGVQGVIVSTVLIVIFSEIIPQAVCTRYGLYVGAKMAPVTKLLLYTIGIVAWPVAKLLEFVLGPHHGIMYRRSELKELIAMHSSAVPHGGDLKRDTVTIIGATLDLQEKVVQQAMTPIDKVFMLHIDAKLDYDTLRKICATGHSRVPIYEEIEVPVSNPNGTSAVGVGLQKVKKIIGILLVKQCVLLDPEDATPVRSLRLNKVPFVPRNEPLLGILDKFQEGRSHMAIVSRFSVDRAASVKKVVKRSLTQRLKDKVVGESSDEEDGNSVKSGKSGKSKDEQEPDLERGSSDAEATLKGQVSWEHDAAKPVDSDDTVSDGFPGVNGTTEEGETAIGAPDHSLGRRGRSKRSRGRALDIEMGAMDSSKEREGATKSRRNSIVKHIRPQNLEANIPADAVLNKEGANQFLQSFDPAVMPVGIITLEDVLEELIGEEIYDEFDPQGGHLPTYDPPDSPRTVAASSGKLKRKNSAPQLTTIPSQSSGPTLVAGSEPAPTGTPPKILRPIPIPALKNLSQNFNFMRSRSAPPTPRDSDDRGRDQIPDPLPPAASEKPSETQMVQAGPTILIESPEWGAAPATALTEGDADYLGQNIVAAELMSKSVSEPPMSAPAAGAASFNVANYAPPISRSASPAPSLEAIILDRRRRLAAGGGASINPPGSTTATGGGGGGGGTSAHELRKQQPLTVPANVRTAPKGRFKSSPLSVGEVPRPFSLDEGERIPTEKDKEGPDKGKEDNEKRE